MSFLFHYFVQPWIVAILGISWMSAAEPWMLALMILCAIVGGVAAWGIPAFVMRATVNYCRVPVWLELLSAFNVIYACVSVAGVFGIAYGAVAVAGAIRDAEERCLSAASASWNVETFREAYHAVAKAGSEDLREFPSPERGGTILPVTEEVTVRIVTDVYTGRTVDRLVQTPTDDWKLSFCRALLSDAARNGLHTAKSEHDAALSERSISIDITINTLLRGAVSVAVDSVGTEILNAAGEVIKSAWLSLCLPPFVVLCLVTLASWRVAYAGWWQD